MTPTMLTPLSSKSIAKRTAIRINCYWSGAIATIVGFSKAKPIARKAH
jgi:hypothetical protein